MNSPVMRYRSFRVVRATMAALLISVALAACGGGSDSGGGSPTPPATQYTVGGAVSGLSGSGLVLQNNGGDDLSVSASGNFTFTTKVASGAAYAVTVKTQPTNPTQVCTVMSGTGTATANVTAVAITCSTNSYTVGGTVSGLVGTGLVLQNNGGGDLAVSASGNFTFAAAVASGTMYAVTVKTQPGSPAQTCAVTGSSGTVTTANVTTVAVTCATNTYTVGGTISGLTGTGLVLKDTVSGHQVTVAANATSFTITPAVSSGSSYAVIVQSQPSGQTCAVTAGSGTVTSAAITSIAVACRNYLVFVTNTYDGTIGALAINPADGSLAAPVTSPVAAGDSNPDGISVSASGSYAYVINNGSHDVTPYSIDVSGALTALTKADTGANTMPYSVAMNPAGTHLYVGSDVTASTGIIGAYAIGAGSVTAIPDPGNTPYISGNTPYGVVVDPSDKFVFSTNQFDVNIVSFPVGSDGTLSTQTVITQFQDGNNLTHGPLGIAVHATSPLLFVTDNVAGTVAVYSYDNAGALTEAAGSPYTVGGAPTGVTVDPTGAFLYVANSADGTVSAFTINATTGALGTIGTYDVDVSNPTLQGPAAIAVDPSGKYAYVANKDGGTVSAFAITPITGVLTLIGTPVVTGGGSAALAIR